MATTQAERDLRKGKRRAAAGVPFSLDALRRSWIAKGIEIGLAAADDEGYRRGAAEAVAAFLDVAAAREMEAVARTRTETATELVERLEVLHNHPDLLAAVKAMYRLPEDRT